MTYKVFFFEDDCNATANNLPITEIDFPPQLFNHIDKEMTKDLINMLKNIVVPLLPRNPIFDNPEREAVMDVVQKIHDNEFNIIDNETNTIVYYGSRPTESEEVYEEVEVTKLSLVEIFQEKARLAKRLAELDARIKTEVSEQVDLLVTQVDKLVAIKDYWLNQKKNQTLDSDLTLEHIQQLSQVTTALSAIKLPT